jgi:hypothetical protein
MRRPIAVDIREAVVGVPGMNDAGHGYLRGQVTPQVVKSARCKMSPSKA